MRVDVVTEVLSRQAEEARAVRRRLDARAVFGINLLGSPGAGKTSLLLATIGHVEWPCAVIEGDLASSVDTDRLRAAGIDATQVNTGGECHLHPSMVAGALEVLTLAPSSMLFVENVGNLVCTADVAIGTHRTVVLASVPEGDDKPLKYPGIFAAADAVVITKADTVHAFDFDEARFRRAVAAVNPTVPCFTVSARTGIGLGAWIDWLDAVRSSGNR